jgi:hypothetical protein
LGDLTHLMLVIAVVHLVNLSCVPAYATIYKKGVRVRSHLTSRHRRRKRSGFRLQNRRKQKG